MYYPPVKAALIHSKKYVTLENTAGNGDAQSATENEVIPTRTKRCFDVLIMSGPPESPEQIVSVPVGPLKVQIMSADTSTPRTLRLSRHVRLGMMLSSIWKDFGIVGNKERGLCPTRK